MTPKNPKESPGCPEDGRGRTGSRENRERPGPHTAAHTGRELKMANFHSILFPDFPGGRQEEPPAQAPEFFTDLNLDQIVAGITAGREAYDLTPLFLQPLYAPEAIEFRQAVMRDLEAGAAETVRDFAAAMRTMRADLAAAENARHPHERARWFLEAAETYCTGVIHLLHDAPRPPPRSRGLRGFFEDLKRYAESATFRTLHRDARSLKSRLSAVRYCLRIKGPAITVRRYAGEPDYSAEVEHLFAKFRQGAVKDYRVRLSRSAGMNHVETEILERVARLYPETFRALAQFSEKHGDFPDPGLVRFDREMQFYLAYLEYTDTATAAGLPFCYPEMARPGDELHCRNGYDLALAHKRIPDGGRIVLNDFRLGARERILVITGPNQGGKTTFARMVGQLHYLAALGLPVPAAAARLLVFDHIFTHFERTETIVNLRGKLQDDLVRIRRILDRATPRSLFIVNELFSSTSLEDALRLSRWILESISSLGAPCVWVTFLDELAAFDHRTVSLVAGVDASDAARRTFKIERRPADGLAYARAIAEKYGLTYARLKERLRP